MCLWTAIGMVLIPLIGIVDYVTGPQIALSIFYLIPIAVVTQLAGRAAGLSASVLSAVVWLVAELPQPVAYAHSLIPYWNALVRLGFFVTVTWFLQRSKVTQQELERAVEKRTRALTTEVAERRQAEAEKAALLEIAREASGTLDLDTLLARVQRHAAAVLNSHAVITFYGAADRLRTVSHYGIDPALIPEVQALAFKPATLFDGRLANGETVVCNDMEQQPWLVADFWSRMRIGSMVAVPLLVRGRWTGVLVVVRSHAKQPFTPGQVALCEGIARQLAVAMEAVETYRARQSEAEVASALARIGRELISSLDTPVLLNRLCQLTTEILQCDSSHTVLWNAQAESWSVVAGYGYAAEEWESAHVLTLPTAALADSAVRMQTRDTVQILVSDLPEGPLRRFVEALGITAALGMALRRGQEFVGFHGACYRGRRQVFSAQQEQIAQGIAQTASLALNNARLVEELGRANNLKSDFVATMSHELRTPLNIMIGYNDLLREGAFGHLSGEQLAVTERMAASSQQLLELINTTLDVGRIESGQLPLDLTSVNLADLVAQLNAETRELQAKPGVQFTWSVPPGLPRLYTDHLKLKVVLKNLIVNALKFTAHGSVTLGAAVRDGGVEIRVSDTGVGIAPDALGIIFEPFRQADSRYGGVGLGLYISRRLVELFGGTLQVQSELGRGSTFEVWVPRQARPQTIG